MASVEGPGRYVFAPGARKQFSGEDVCSHTSELAPHELWWETFCRRLSGEEAYVCHYGTARSLGGGRVFDFVGAHGACERRSYAPPGRLAML